MSKNKASAASPKKAPAAAKKPAKAEVSLSSEGVAGQKRASLHPRYREISVVMTNGETFKTRSTYSSDILKLDIDITTHPAWTKESNFVNAKANKINAFSNKYNGLDFLKSK